MEFSKVIEKRKSIRKYKNKKVPKSILKQIIKDATKAPSSQNKQPWEFYVITDKKTRDKIAKILSKSLKIYKNKFNKLNKKLKKPAINLYSNLGSCQNIIFVYTGKNSKINDIMSISCAIENLMLSAANKGLGTCWIGTFKKFEKEINKLLKIKNKKLVAGILIGYQNEKPLKRKKKPLSKIIKFV